MGGLRQGSCGSWLVVGRSITYHWIPIPIMQNEPEPEPIVYPNCVLRQPLRPARKAKAPRQPVEGRI
jgi:hypothetical protein